MICLQSEESDDFKKSEFSRVHKVLLKPAAVGGGWKFRQKCWVFEKDANHLDFKSHNWKLFTTSNLTMAHWKRNVIQKLEYSIRSSVHIFIDTWLINYEVPQRNVYLGGGGTPNVLYILEVRILRSGIPDLIFPFIWTSCFHTSSLHKYILFSYIFSS